MEKIIQYLNKQSKPFFIILGALLVLFIAIVDFLTQDYFVLQFYIIPIVLGAWFAGRNTGFFMALVSAIGEIILDIIESPHHLNPFVHYWNFFMNFSFFLLIVYFLTLLKETMEIKSKFTSTVSHELRTPLSVIKESIEVVREGLYGNINDKQNSILNMALVNVHRLAQLINDILDFQKFESGKIKIIFEKNDMNKVIQDAYKGVELLNKEKDLKIIFNLDEDLPETKFDRDKIIQVIVNLLDNAIKFTEKGSISISTKKNGKEILVVIRDTGCGIKAVDMPRLFKSFEQLGEPGKHGRKGTGLGLAISKEIVMRHGGKIWAESEFGRGTAFYFTLPIKI